jgi:hypothetical protein
MKAECVEGSCRAYQCVLRWCALTPKMQATTMFLCKIDVGAMLTHAVVDVCH